MTACSETEYPKFQSTPPVREVTAFSLFPLSVCTISIHTSRAGGDDALILCFIRVIISIHTSRAGGDFTQIDCFVCPVISIHTSRAGGDLSGQP